MYERSSSQCNVRTENVGFVPTLKWHYDAKNFLVMSGIDECSDKSFLHSDGLLIINIYIRGSPNICSTIVTLHIS